MNYVLDACVVVGLFVPQPASDYSIAFVSEALAQPGTSFFAPDCLYYEVAATLQKFERLGAYNDLDDDLLKLYEMPIISVPCKELMQRATSISREHIISTYDSFYLALAQREGLPLVTADERLVNGTQGKGFNVRRVAAV